MNIILASQSPRRRELLKLIGLDYTAITSDAKEEIPKGVSPDELVENLALAKARDVFSRYGSDCVIGADTVVYIDGHIIGKPRDEHEALITLTRLQGRTHKVYTGVAVMTPEKELVSHDVTDVTFAQMSSQELDWYVSTGEPLDKAGAYGIQGPGGVFIERVEGSYFNVIGLPLHMLYRMLKEAGITLDSYKLPL